MCCGVDCKEPQHKNMAAKVSASDMKEAGECLTLGLTGRKRNATSTVENWQKEECAVDDSGVKFGSSDDRSVPGRILRQKLNEEEVCVTPVKLTPIPAAVKDENSAGRDWTSLPLDVWVKVICNLGHHELEPLTRVSKDFKQAVKVANETHFAFKTPDHVRRPNRATPQAPERVGNQSQAPERVGNHRNLVGPIGPEIRVSILVLSGLVSAVTVIVLLHIFLQQFAIMRGGQRLRNSLIENSRWITQRAALISMLMGLLFSLFFTCSRLLLSRLL